MSVNFKDFFDKRQKLLYEDEGKSMKRGENHYISGHVESGQQRGLLITDHRLIHVTASHHSSATLLNMLQISFFPFKKMLWKLCQLASVDWIDCITTSVSNQVKGIECLRHCDRFQVRFQIGLEAQMRKWKNEGRRAGCYWYCMHLQAGATSVMGTLCIPTLLFTQHNEMKIYLVR